MLIDNPYTLYDTDFEDSMVEFGYSHALISIETFEKYLDNCPHWPQKEMIHYNYTEDKNYKFQPIVIKNYNVPWKFVTKKCNEARLEIMQQFNETNIYGIHRECLTSKASLEFAKEFKNIDYEEVKLHSENNNFIQMIKKQKEKQYLPNESNILGDEEMPEFIQAINFFPTCYPDTYTADFLNNNTIKTKLGVDSSIQHQSCTNKYTYYYGESFDFYQNDIKELSKEKNFTTWLFSGTEDIAVTTLGTMRMINELNYTIVNKWRPWMVDGQVAGMEQDYEYGFRFITVKGAGHMVPQDVPKAAKEILDKFIKLNKDEYEEMKKKEEEERKKKEEEERKEKEEEERKKKEEEERKKKEEEERKKKEDDDKKKENDFPIWAIILIVLFVLILLALVILIIIVKRKKQGNISKNGIGIEESPSLLEDMNDN